MSSGSCIRFRASGPIHAARSSNWQDPLKLKLKTKRLQPVQWLQSPNTTCLLLEHQLHSELLNHTFQAQLIEPR